MLASGLPPPAGAPAAPGKRSAARIACTQSGRCVSVAHAGAGDWQPQQCRLLPWPEASRCVAAASGGTQSAADEQDVERVHSHAHTSTSSSVLMVNGSSQRQRHQQQAPVALELVPRAPNGNGTCAPQLQAGVEQLVLHDHTQLYVSEPWHSTCNGNGNGHLATSSHTPHGATTRSSTAPSAGSHTARQQQQQQQQGNGASSVSSNASDSTCHRPKESAAGVTPAKLAALSTALHVPVKQMQHHLHRHPQLLQVPPDQLAHAHQALTQDLGLPQRAARLMLTHHPHDAVRLPASELQARAAHLASLLGRGVTPKHVLQAAGRGVGSLLTREPSIVAAHITQLAHALNSGDFAGHAGTHLPLSAPPSPSTAAAAVTAATLAPPAAAGAAQPAPSAPAPAAKWVLPMPAVLEMVGLAPELLTKPPEVVARRFDECVAVLQGRKVPSRTPNGSSNTGSSGRGSGGSSGGGGREAAGSGTQAQQAGSRADSVPLAPLSASGADSSREWTQHTVLSEQEQEQQQRPQRRPSRASVLRALRRQPDLLLLGARVLGNKLAVLQSIVDRPRRLVAPLLLACPALARHDLDAVRAAYEVLRPITGRDEGFAFGMVCHAPHLLLSHPQTLASQALAVRQAVRAADGWRKQLVRYSPAQAADLLGLTAPTYARLAYLVHTKQAHAIGLHEALCMPRGEFLSRFPGASSSPLMAVTVKKRPLARIPRWKKVQAAALLQQQQQQQQGGAQGKAGARAVGAGAGGGKQGAVAALLGQWVESGAVPADQQLQQQQQQDAHHDDGQQQQEEQEVALLLQQHLGAPPASVLEAGLLHQEAQLPLHAGGWELQHASCAVDASSQAQQHQEQQQHQQQVASGAEPPPPAASKRGRRRKRDAPLQHLPQQPLEAPSQQHVGPQADHVAPVAPVTLVLQPPAPSFEDAGSSSDGLSHAVEPLLPLPLQQPPQHDVAANGSSSNGHHHHNDLQLLHAAAGVSLSAPTQHQVLSGALAALPLPSTTVSCGNGKGGQLVGNLVAAPQGQHVRANGHVSPRGMHAEGEEEVAEVEAASDEEVWVQHHAPAQPPTLQQQQQQQQQQVARRARVQVMRLGAAAPAATAGVAVGAFKQRPGGRHLRGTP